MKKIKLEIPEEIKAIKYRECKKETRIIHIYEEKKNNDGNKNERGSDL